MLRRKLTVYIMILLMIVSLLPVTARADGTISVTISVLGDDPHNSDEDGVVHTFAKGNLQEWVAPTLYTDVSPEDSVWDLLQRVFEENGLEAIWTYNEMYGSVYVQGVVCNGITLCEKDNGAGSGWMYKINGNDVEVGISAKTMNDGDVVVFHYTDDYTQESYGNPEDEANALAVEDLISAIGTVTLKSKKKIRAARDAYDALSFNAQSLVTNYDVLLAAESVYAGLEADAAAAKAVEDLINAIGDVSLDSGPAIDAARSAYDELTDSQKGMVTNLQTLTDAESSYAALAATEADQKKADAVIKKIQKIGPVTPESAETIAAARSAYNALTKTQKSMVTNVNVLTDSEKAFPVVEEIAEIGEVTSKSGKIIQSARNAYESLSDTQKQLVSNLDVLTEAEAAYDVSRAKVVMRKIKAIGTVSPDSRETIEAARAAYNALTKAQKNNVTNLSSLNDAETVLAVEDQIAAIGTVTLEKEDTIRAARRAYERLSDAQKERAASLSVLEAAEKRLEELKEEQNDKPEVPVEEGDWPGSGTASDPFQLRDLNDLEKLLKAVNEEEKSFSGVTFLMTADITIPADWAGIGTVRSGASGTGDGVNIVPFSGIFDGGGHLLSVADGGAALFGFVRGAVIRNLALYGSNIRSDGLVRNYTVDYGPSGVYDGTISRIATFENITITAGTCTLYSGIIGNADPAYITSAYSQTTSSNSLYFCNCVVEPGVTVGYDGGSSCIGSLAGHFNGTIESCSSGADVYGTDRVGGLVGYKDTSMGDCNIDGSSFYGSVHASGYYAGGICGSGYDHETAPNARCVSIENCTVSGSVSGASAVGGILGGEPGLWQAWENGVAYIRNNTFCGIVSGSENVGAILGFYRSLNRYTVIEHNFFASGCGTDKGIGNVLYVDSEIYSNDDSKPVGWQNGVYCFDTSEDDIRWIKSDLNAESAYYNIARENHNRFDDPLGTDAASLCSSYTPEEPEVPYATDLTASGTYKTEYVTGESLDLSGLVLTVTYSDGTTLQIAPEDASVNGFSSENPGNGSITITYDGCSTLIAYTVRPPAEEPADGSKTSVTIAVYGDYIHDSDSDHAVHGLAMGGLTTWVAPTETEASTSETVWDVLQRVFSANGITPVTTQSLGTVYISALIFNGEKVGEFTNGSKSGWMYTVNGTHPLESVAQRYIKNGDVIVFHYTDDYTKEEGSSGYDNGSGQGQGGGPGGSSGGSQSDKDDAAVKEVEQLIDAIGTPVTTESAEKIRAARSAYNALNYTQKNKVTNYKKLTDAEAALAAIDKTEEKKPDPIIEEARIKEYRKIFEQAGDYIASLGDPSQGTVGGRWMALGLARSGRAVDPSYYASVEAYVLENIDENERLHFAKSTDNSGEIIALSALGYDVTDVAGHNLLKGLTDLAFVKKQGINGPIWALIAFDSGQYGIPKDPNASEQVTRENLISTILDAQLADGGWALSGDQSDSDMTGMALQALAPYYTKDPKVRAAIDTALETLSRMQNADGSFSAFGGDGGLIPTSESIAQVLTALSALGIDADTDPRFIKDGNSVVSALCAFYVEGSGFRHLMDGPVDGMATEQAYYALTAYFRMLDGQTALYDMTDVLSGTEPKKEKTEEKKESSKEKDPEVSETPVPAEEPSDTEATGAVTEETADEGTEEVVLAAAAIGTETKKETPVLPLVLVAAACAAAIAAVLIIRKRKTAEEEGGAEDDEEEKTEDR